MKSVTIIIPTRNEERGLAYTLARMPHDELKKRGYLHEILVVDSGSSDRTTSVAQAKAATVVNEVRLGYGRAYKTGLTVASGDYIVALDGDGSYPPWVIPDLLDFLTANDLDFVGTNRLAGLTPGSMTPTHIVGNKILTLLARTFFATETKDSQSGMWACKRGLLESVSVASDGMGFSQELKIRCFSLGKCAEYPIPYLPRIGTSTFMTVRDGLSVFFGQFRLFAGGRGRSLPTEGPALAPSLVHLGRVDPLLKIGRD